MPGLLVDVNVQGHLPYLRRMMEKVGVLDLVEGFGLALQRFPDVGLDRHINDRMLWHYCQANGWVLFTDNCNDESADSLHATIQDSWREGHLPVITLANKGRFERSEVYALAVAEEVADVLVRLFYDQVRDQPRLFVPR
jgi:hypothetical protein